MTSQEIAIYRDIEKAAGNGMKTIDVLEELVRDEALSLLLMRQMLKYSEVYQEAARRLLDADTAGYRSTVVEDALLKTGLHYNTMLNSSTGRIAELLIKNSANSILDMEKSIRHYGDAGYGSVSLAKQLISLEEKNQARLKQYL